jgi:hypothetical protein
MPESAKIVATLNINLVKNSILKNLTCGPDRS